MLFGRSGLGKTSLLKAGLFPCAAAGRISCRSTCGSISRRRATRGDARRSIEQLFAAFTAAVRGRRAPMRRRAKPDESLWDYLHRTDVKVWSAQNQPLVPVFVIDQFEEVFTLGPANPPAVARLREDLADLAENRIPVATEQRLAADEDAAARLALRSQRYRMLLSFREDFATAFERWHELPSLMRNRLQLLPMTGAQAFDAVYGSASHLMDRDTAEQIVRFVASEKHARPGGCRARHHAARRARRRARAAEPRVPRIERQPPRAPSRAAARIASIATCWRRRAQASSTATTTRACAISRNACIGSSSASSSPKAASASRARRMTRCASRTAWRSTR